MRLALGIAVHAAFLLLLLLPAAADQPAPLLEILREELSRNFEGLKSADPPVYHLAYSISDLEIEMVAATNGALLARDHSRSRVLDVTLRVGNAQLDNYHPLRGSAPRFTSALSLPLEDNRQAIKRRVWRETDRIYRLAAQRFIAVKANSEVKVAESDPSGDFSEAPVAVATEQVPPLKFNSEEWAARVRKASGKFRDYPAVIASNVSVVLTRETKFLVNNEGTRLQHGRLFAHLNVRARGKAADGMDIETNETLNVSDALRLPDETALLQVVEKVSKSLTALTRAPVAEPFAGPAILSGSAAAVFFHEIFGHRVEGHRQKDESEGQTFTKSVNAPVLPDFLSVVFDPTMRTLAGQDLNGFYSFDDEGVKAEPVTVVDKGILKSFLMSRSPIAGFSRSNGHGRRQHGHEVVSRQSNLLVHSTKQVPDRKLRELLVEEIKRQNKPYGLYFEEISGGYTTTRRRGLQAFTVIPIVVYLVYPDGRADELVRGADIVGTPLTSFGRIVATSDRVEIFNGLCGAESGSVPVSAAAPAILVSEIEIQKKQKSDERPPLLNRPMPPSGL